MTYRAVRPLVVIFILAALASAQDLASFEKRITVKKLAEWLDRRHLRAS